VCPFNYVSLKRGLRADIPELGAEAGVGESLSLQEVLLMRDSAAFERRFAGTALMRAKREGLVRNAAVVAANTGASELLGALELAAREDSSAIVRQHALWGYVTLALASGERPRPVIRNRVREALSDPTPEVAAEARQLLEHDA
jgi:epoxyqueuosine reductase